MEEHLAANGIDLKKTQLTLGPVLRMDPQTEQFIGNGKASELLTRKYRAPFLGTRKGLRPITSAMNGSSNNGSSRREFLKQAGRFATVSALAGVSLPHVHAAADNAIGLALIGCGGRGSGAVVDAYDSPMGR